MKATTLSEEAVRWLVDGEKGLSSEAMFHRLVLGRQVRAWDYPHDADDFQRCERLRRAVPEVRDGLPNMALVGPVWAELVKVWDEIVAAFEKEAPGVCDIGWRAVPNGWRVPVTYRLIDEAIERGRAVQ